MHRHNDLRLTPRDYCILYHYRKRQLESSLWPSLLLLKNLVDDINDTFLEGSVIPTKVILGSSRFDDLGNDTLGVDDIGVTTFRESTFELRESFVQDIDYRLRSQRIGSDQSNPFTGSLFVG